MHWVAVAAVDTLACVSWLQVTSGLWATPDGPATMWPAIFDGIAAWRTVGVSAVFRRKLNKVGMAVFLRRRRPSCRPLSNWSCSKWSSQILEPSTYLVWLVLPTSFAVQGLAGNENNAAP